MVKKTNTYINNLQNDKQIDPNVIGERASSFAKIYNSSKNIPRTFVITSFAFDDFLIINNLVEPILSVLQDVRPFIRKSAEEASGQIGNILMSAPIPVVIREAIYDAYLQIGRKVSNPFVTIEISSIIDPKFVPSKDAKLKYFDIKGEDELMSKVKLAWLNLFSADAIELRTNGYYNGPISTALIMQKMIRSEISGKYYSFPPITKEDNTVEVYAIYGMKDETIDVESSGDGYKVQLDPKKIIEKNILPQDHMIVRRAKIDPSRGVNMTVEISKEWQKRQKLDDSRIFQIVEEGVQIEAKMKKPVEIEWGIEGGRLYIQDIYLTEYENKLENAGIEANAEMLKDLNIDILPDQLDLDRRKPDLEKIEREIQELVKNDDEYIKKNRKNDEYQPIIPKRTKKPNEYVKWSQKYKVITDIYLDISTLNSNNLHTLDLFDGTFFDGTQPFVDNKVIPELVFDDFSKLKSLKETISIDIATAAKNSSKGQLIYQFSSITDYEYKEMGIDIADGTFEGDERFIDEPKTLAFEVQCIRAAKEEFNCNNISICFPSLRNSKNLKDLKHIVNSLGLKRSIKMNFFAEIAVPSFVHDLDQIDSELIDGFILNYDTLLKLSVYRKEIREIDHKVILNLMMTVSNVCRIKKLKFYVKIDEVNIHALDNIMRVRPHAVIFNYIPTEEQIKYLQSIELDFLEKKSKLFTEIGK